MGASAWAVRDGRVRVAGWSAAGGRRVLDGWPWATGHLAAQSAGVVGRPARAVVVEDVFIAPKLVRAGLVVQWRAGQAAAGWCLATQPAAEPGRVTADAWRRRLGLPRLRGGDQKAAVQRWVAAYVRSWDDAVAAIDRRGAAAGSAEHLADAIGIALSAVQDLVDTRRCPDVGPGRDTQDPGGPDGGGRDDG